MFNLFKNRISKYLFVISLLALYFSTSTVSFAVDYPQADVESRTQSEIPGTQPLSAPPSPKDNTKTFCSGVSGIPESAACNIVYYIMLTFLQVFGRMAQLTASMFDWAVTEYILNIKDLFNDDVGASRPFVYNSWSLVRDVVNIVMFFSAMYVGVRYILGKEDLDFKKSIIKIGLFAVFVNFSFVVAKFLVDISNVFSLFIRANIFKEIGGTGISDAIMNYTGISPIVQAVGNPSSTFAGFTSWQGMFMAILFLFVAFFVFAYATIAVLLRAIILLLCVIASPLMFVANSFKSMDKVNEVWRENFFGQLLFAPVLMLMLWLSIGFLKEANSEREKIWQAAENTTLQSGATAEAVGSAIAPSAIMATGSTLLAMLVLILAVFVSGKISGGLGSAAGNMVGGAVKNLGLAAVTGGAGLAIRGTMGRAGSAIANSKWVKDKKENGGALSKRMASGIALAGDKMANAKVTVGGKSSMSTNDKAKAAADVVLKERDDLIRENKEGLKNAGLTDQSNKVKSKEQLAVLKEMLKNRAGEADKTKWKKEEDIKKALGIGVNDVKMSKAENKLAEADLLRAEKDKKAEELRGKKERLKVLSDEMINLRGGIKNGQPKEERAEIGKKLDASRNEMAGLNKASDGLKKQMQDLESQAAAKEKEVTSSLMYAAGQRVASAKESIKVVTDPIVEKSKRVASVPAGMAKSVSDGVNTVKEAVKSTGNLSAGFRSKKSGAATQSATSGPDLTPEQQQAAADSAADRSTSQ